MVVLVLTACPASLRGHVTRWVLEISPGVFVGRMPARVRDELWDRVMELCLDGRAIMVISTRNEQGFDFRVHNHNWEVIDADGLRLMRRPSQNSNGANPMRRGWSKASRYRRAVKRGRG
ncbi:type I-E CRISPR-associated endoribonuclease Cas2 [Propionibacterium australiense]|uniref:type I-E CRISPR-associated endoribonuclease Cas2e n=1 Tax=Propionibacterium australiense TaxID=119981 RepID=UPI000E5A3FF5|nr:type I-E CRISPR-associated endoribonuclease Cas2e [Propionibacterium australiense]RLP07518.1 type I-E CRISPR-associated endoribonuclease Cas2 [Propionibacterium australiense]